MEDVEIDDHPRPEAPLPVGAADGVDWRVTCPTCHGSRLVMRTVIRKGGGQHCPGCERKERC